MSKISVQSFLVLIVISGVLLIASGAVAWQTVKREQAIMRTHVETAE